ncbi:uncharacterized protein LOC107714213 [Sinocyclocheilus rhinocerous]|uniref:uncharacterized protein LOC107714213 n=1 Tax=Sinocyclocheilus rhinocerous TaxID=307959 RepID=UPI0007BA246D|nr:PREDICTED: uncharacterized protein LOC107714213 [Sinocyclocheilus rhinocerous]
MNLHILRIFAFAGVLFCEQQRVFGAEVDMRVKAGDSITLYSDCVMPSGSHIFWWRNCSHEHQPSLFIEAENLFQRTFPRFSFVLNSSSNSYDLHITNISVSDEGLYYCVIKERKVHDVHGIVGSEYQYGNRRTRLSLLEPASPHAEQFNTSSTPPVSDLCWSPLSEDEVCYASLNTLSMLKKKTLQNSDFCTYTEVRTKRTQREDSGTL